MDIIENSNLCRQFLFREWDVQQEKSTVAARAATVMNPEFQPLALNIKVAPDTSTTYNDHFWNSQDIIVNALDNVKARQYVDTQCTFYGKPLLESGTLGVVANVQPIVPHLTQCYNDVLDPPEKETAICTLKTFPYKVEHTIQWARDVFGGTFEQSPAQANQYLGAAGGGGDKWVQEMRGDSKSGVTRMKTVHSLLVNTKNSAGRCMNFDDCVRFARLQFEALFVTPIKNLLHQHPADKRDDDGQLFWRGDKKLCKPALFNVDDEDHLNFLKASTHLCANLYRVELPSKEEGGGAGAGGGGGGGGGTSLDDLLRESAKKVVVPEFSPVGAPKIAVNDEEAKKMEEEGDAARHPSKEEEGCDIIGSLSSALPIDLVGGSWTMVCEEFEKDDDTNFHMDFITAASNLRCFNYDIRDVTGRVGADKMKTRKIAGKIIPAIATTTAIATGAAMLELFKLLLGKNNIEDYRAWNFNVGINQFTLFEPVPCDVDEFAGKKFSVWSYIDVQDQKVSDFMTWFEEQYDVEIESIGQNEIVVIDCCLWDDDDIEKIKDMLLSESVANARKVDVSEITANMYMMLDVEAEVEEGEEEEEEEEEDQFMPQIRVKLK